MPKILPDYTIGGVTLYTVFEYNDFHHPLLWPGKFITYRKTGILL